MTTVAKELADYVDKERPKLEKKSRKKKWESNIKIALDFIRRQCVNVSDVDYKAYKEIDRIREIRHCVAHNNSRLDETGKDQTQRLKMYISHTDHIGLEYDEDIILSPGFLPYFLGLQRKCATDPADALAKFEEKNEPV